MEDSYTGHQRGQPGNTRDDGTPHRLPRDPKSGYLVRDLSWLQTSTNIELENMISSYTLLVVAMQFLWRVIFELTVGTKSNLARVKIMSPFSHLIFGGMGMDDQTRVGFWGPIMCGSGRAKYSWKGGFWREKCSLKCLISPEWSFKGQIFKNFRLRRQFFLKITQKAYFE